MGARMQDAKLEQADLRGARVDATFWTTAKVRGAKVDIDQAVSYAVAHGLVLGDYPREQARKPLIPVVSGRCVCSRSASRP